MTSTTTILSLPLIAPAQAQKHVTHNEALAQLDAMVQLSVEDRTRTAPPSGPVPGQVHIVAAAATGAWAGQNHHIAVWNGSAWEFHAPMPGWRAYVQAEDVLAFFDGSTWFTQAEKPAEFPMLGVNATADATNRIVVKAPSSLFDAEIASHQLTINKTSAGATSSVLFQTGYAGHAAIGLIGNNDLTVKVSPDGSSFVDGLTVDGTSGQVTVKQWLNLAPGSGDPASPADGDLWYNSTLGKFRARQAGTTVNVVSTGGGGGGSGTMSDSDFLLQDNVDPTKQAHFELSGLSTGVLRSYDLPDMSGELALQAQFADRAAALAWLAAANVADGALITVKGLAFRKQTGATAIADMAGWLPAQEVFADHFGENATPGTTDMTSAIQAALTYVGGLGGGEVHLEASDYVAAGLSLPNQVYLVGRGIEASTLKLKSGANTWLLASSNYVANANFANLYGGTRDLTLDGNKAANPTGSLVWFAAYRASFLRSRFVNSAASGLVLTAMMSDGTTALTNGIAENQVVQCHFDTCDGHGIWGHDGTASKLADAEIDGCHIYAPGGSAIHIERAAGWKITNNQIYDAGLNCIYLDKLARSVVQANHLDLKGAGLSAGGRAACIHVNSFSTQGDWVIGGNIFLINQTADTATRNLHGLAFEGATTFGGLVFGNAFVDASTAQLASDTYFSTTAAASMAAVQFGLSALGPNKDFAVPGVLTVPASKLVIQDQTDPSKKGQFGLSGLTTGTTRSFQLPDANGTLALDAIFTSGAKGLVPASGGGTASYLRADGSFAAVDLTTGASGTLQAAQEPAHTGDVTNTAGSLALTIAAGAVANAKLASMAAATLKGNNTGGTAAPADLTASQVKTMLAIASGDVSGLGTLATASSVSLTTQATGTLQAAQAPALSGDVTSSAGALATTIAAGAVSLAKMANMATSSLIYRKTAGSGAPEVNTLATLKTDLGLTGTNSGDQTITLTGDVTGSGVGSFAATIAAGAVSLSKMANLTAGTILGNNTGSAAAPLALTPAQVKTLLAIASGDVSGLGTLATASSVSLTTQATGTLQAAQAPALNGDVTSSAGALATTIAAGAVSNAKLASMAANTVKANATAGSATPTDVALSASQLFGRGASGNLAAITLGTNLSMSGTTLNAAGGGGGGDAFLANNQTWTGSNTYSGGAGETVSFDGYDSVGVGGGTGFFYVDSQAFFADGTGGLNIHNLVDNTKHLAFDASLIATGTTRTLAAPDASGTIALTASTVSLAGADTITGTKTINAPALVLRDTTDTTKKGTFDASGISTGTTQTYFLPNASGFLGLGDYFGVLTANYTLTSTTSTQKLFNWSANGALSLAAGYYSFETVIFLASMSATSGNAAFNLLGAGTATLSTILYHTDGADSSTPSTTVSAASGQVSVAAGSAASMVSAGTGTGMQVHISGTFRVTAAGTIVPSVGLVTAAAAVVQAGSFFRCSFIGTGNTAGTWS